VPVTGPPASTEIGPVVPPSLLPLPPQLLGVELQLEGGAWHLLVEVSHHQPP
jgi:hypothetical protein